MIHVAGPQGPALRALIRWQHAAGPFWPYVSATPFLSGAGRHERTVEAAGGLPDLHTGLVLFLDLPLSQTLGLAPRLGREGFVVVPVIQRWCTDPAVIPSSELLSALVACARSLRRPREPQGAVFLLDGDRAGPKRPRLTIFDNRYRYNPNAFPPAEILKRQGITTVRLISRGEPAQDLWAYLDALARGGLPCAFS